MRQRKTDALRKVEIIKNVNLYAEGSCLIKCGDTHVLCTATADSHTPDWLKDKNTGWVTAEYNLLPRSTITRVSREKSLNAGRTHEIKRLIGRSLRAVVDLEKCRGCVVCQLEKACPVKVAQVADGKLRIDPEACKNCGRCVGKCPFHVADTFVNGFRVYLGGRWGKNVAHGRPMETLFTSEEEVLDIVEKTILFFKDQGLPGERLSQTMERVGFEKACAMIESDELLERKEEIIGK